MSDSDLLTPQELADFLDVKLSTVYYWSHIGYIPKVRIGRFLRFRKSKIESWILKKERTDFMQKIPLRKPLLQRRRKLVIRQVPAC